MFKILLSALICGLIGFPLLAQVASPKSAEQMIEQLKEPRTRSLRNLTIQAVNSPASASQPATGSTSDRVEPEPQRPSLSLLIQFDFNSTTIRPESRRALINLSNALQSEQLADSRFAIEGHTDAKGLEELNVKLSQRRAQSVREFLQSRGVSESRLDAIGKGSSELANRTDPFAAENRRVRIVNLD